MSECEYCSYIGKQPVGAISRYVSGVGEHWMLCERCASNFGLLYVLHEHEDESLQWKLTKLKEEA